METQPCFIEVITVAGRYHANDENQSAFDKFLIAKCHLFKIIRRIPDGVGNVIFMSKSYDTRILPLAGSLHVIKSGVLSKQGHRTHCILSAYSAYKIRFTLKFEARVVPVKLEQRYKMYGEVVPKVHRRN